MIEEAYLVQDTSHSKRLSHTFAYGIWDLKRVYMYMFFNNVDIYEASLQCVLACGIWAGNLVQNLFHILGIQ